MKRNKKEHITLTLVFASIVFVILLLSAAIALLLVLIAYRLGVVNYDFSKPMSRALPFIVFAIISLVAGMAISFIVGKISLKPIRTIVNATNRLAKGDFSVRLNISTPYEFAELTESFNNMAKELGSTEMLRSDFINNFSHEFKTPIVSISGFAKMLKKDDLSTEERNECINIIVSESGRLTELATNILNLTKIEKQAIISDKTDFNLSEQLRHVILLLEQKWSGKKLEIEFEGEECTVNANEELLRQVWINLLDNAIKFSPEYSKVIISVKESDMLEVEFKDYGPGMDENVKKRIFDKFYQGDPSHSTAGNGLGLALCKNIIEKHKGKIDVTSAPGEGSVFTVTLPKTTE